VDGDVGGGASYTDDSGAEGRCAEADVRVVGEAKAFPGDAEERAIEPGVGVFVVNGGHCIIAGREVGPDRDGDASGLIDGRRAGTKCFRLVFRPAGGRGEEDGAEIAAGVAEAIDMDAERAPG
jgi:hypothetical protein